MFVFCNYYTSKNLPWSHKSFVFKRRNLKKMLFQCSFKKKWFFDIVLKYSEHYKNRMCMRAIKTYISKLLKNSCNRSRSKKYWKNVRYDSRSIIRVDDIQFKNAQPLFYRAYVREKLIKHSMRMAKRSS